jgi:hypothetical protein
MGLLFSMYSPPPIKDVELLIMVQFISFGLLPSFKQIPAPKSAFTFPVIEQLVIVGDTPEQYMPLFPPVIVKPAMTQFASSPPEKVTTLLLPSPSIIVVATIAELLGSADLSVRFLP